MRLAFLERVQGNGPAKCGSRGSLQVAEAASSIRDSRFSKVPTRLLSLGPLPGNIKQSVGLILTVPGCFVPLISQISGHTPTASRRVSCLLRNALVCLRLFLAVRPSGPSSLHGPHSPFGKSLQRAFRCKCCSPARAAMRVTLAMRVTGPLVVSFSTVSHLLLLLVV
jgi:hypothetical protein